MDDNQLQSSRSDAELKQLEYNHKERVIALGIIGVIAVGGVIGMVFNVQGAQTVVVGVIGLFTGWMGAKIPEHWKKERLQLDTQRKDPRGKKR
jgi:hypothetical protein